MLGLTRQLYVLFYDAFAVVRPTLVGGLLLTLPLTAEQVTQQQPSVLAVQHQGAKNKSPKGRNNLESWCIDLANQTRSKLKKPVLAMLCQRAKELTGCKSEKNKSIFHFDDKADEKNSRRILVFGLVHGDEQPTAAVVYRWAARLLKIQSRNSWRLIPGVNPDGFALNKRTNHNGVDLNRNFPSKDWDEKALRWWKKRKRSDPRRYPGPKKASEAETRCMMAHIADFRPDLVVSIHIPYGVLDYDGPKLSFPRVGFLPWVRLGTYPGSLGRYLWVDRKRPVLTIELKGSAHANKNYFQLQDISGTVAKRINRR